MKRTSNREEKMSLVQQKLEEGVRDIFESNKYKEYIDTMSRFPRYSINNCILIACQCPEASHVCGFKKWQTDFNRTVNKGEHGIMIIAPIKIKADVEEPLYDENSKPVLKDDGTQETETVSREFQGVKPAYVFDVSQTSGEPLPSIVEQLNESVDGYEQLKNILIEVSPVPVSFERIDGGANGYYSPGSQRIVIKNDLPELQTIKTMIHEIGHASLGHGSKEDKWDRETKEVQAESVAYWVSQMIGLDTSDYSFGYISGWSKDKEVSELKDNLDIIKQAADKISLAIEEKLLALHKEEKECKEEPVERIIKKSR